MPYDAVSTPTRPRQRADHDGARIPVATPAPTAPAVSPPPSASPEGIGDIVLAGESSGYAHLAARSTPTVGRLVTAARNAASALARPALHPRRCGRWQLVPRAARRRTAGRMRVTAVALEPNEFTALTQGRGSDALHLVSGRAHLVVTAADGDMLAVQEFTPGRTRVLGSADRHRLVNTGDTRAVVVRVTG